MLRSRILLIVWIQVNGLSWGEKSWGGDSVDSLETGAVAVAFTSKICCRRNFKSCKLVTSHEGATGNGERGGREEQGRGERELKLIR